MINMSELTSFEEQYVCLEANSVEEMQDWISRQHAHFRVKPLEDSRAGNVAKISRATFDDVALVSYRYNLAFQGDFSADYDAYFISLPISGSARRISPLNGEIQHLPTQMTIYRGLAGRRNVISSDYTHVSLTVPADLKERHLQSLLGCELKSPLTFTPLVGMDSGPGRAVASLINYITSQFVHLSDPFHNAITSATMKSHLCTVLLGSLNHNYSSALHVGSATPIPRTVKRAEEYMRELCAEAITIEELAGVAGCSARSLYAAFQSFRGSTPMAVLCDIRLEAAHNEIINEMGTVTEIAYKYGFSNAGRFAKQYAQKFGQKPSQTRLMGIRTYPTSTYKHPASSLTG